MVLSAEDLDSIKTKTKDIAPSSFRIYNNIYQSKENLETNIPIVIQKFDQVNSIVNSWWGQVKVVMLIPIWYPLFLEFSLVDNWFFVHPHDQLAAIHLENVRQLNREDEAKSWMSIC